MTTQRSPFRRVTGSKGYRIYTWHGIQYPSVTSIIGKVLAKPALQNWYARRTATEAVNNLELLDTMLNQTGDPTATIDWLAGAPQRSFDRGAKLGSLLHDYAEAYVLDREPPEPKHEQVRAMAAQFLLFLNDHKPEFLVSEAPVFNLDVGYGGTLDFIATIAGTTYIGDYKTGRTGPWPESALQLAAYRHADFIGMPDGTEIPIPETDAAVVVRIRPDFYSVVDIDTGPEIFDTFKRVRSLFDWQANDAGMETIGNQWINS